VEKAARAIVIESRRLEGSCVYQNLCGRDIRSQLTKHGLCSVALKSGN